MVNHPGSTGGTLLTTTTEGVGLIDSRTEPKSEQYWRFQFEHLEVVSFEYDLTEGKKVVEEPDIPLPMGILQNSSTSDGNITYKGKWVTRETFKWETTNGLKIGGNLKVTCAYFA
jgi:hypothetical protein